jgi:hypothetical protein
LGLRLGFLVKIHAGHMRWIGVVAGTGIIEVIFAPLSLGLGEHIIFLSQVVYSRAQLFYFDIFFLLQK